MKPVLAASLLSFMLLFGCGIPLTYPVTDGFHNVLPQPHTRIVVWGREPAVVGQATAWLQKRGLIIVERARLHQIFEEQRIRLTHTPDDDADVLRVGKLLGASMIVFTDSSSTAGIQSLYYQGVGSSRSVHAASVSIRGVDVETGEVVWSGTARYPTMNASSVEDALSKLTCQALATAWGFRPTGQDAIPSPSMCTVGMPGADRMSVAECHFPSKPSACNPT